MPFRIKISINQFNFKTSHKVKFKMKKVKSIFVIALLLVGLSTGLKAQSSDAKVTMTKIVNASADDVWTVIRQMDDLDAYSSLIGSVDWTGAHGIGGQRV